MVGCFIHAHHDHQTQRNEDTAYDPKQSAEESEWSNNGQLAILVPGQIIHTPFLVELALRASVAASLREGHAAAVWGHHAEVGHSQPVTSQGGVSMRG